MIRQGRKMVPAGLRLFPKGDKYGHSDSIIRSSRIVCGAYAFAPYIGGCAPRPHPPRLSPVGAICGAYAFAPYKRGCAPHLLSPFLSLMKEKEAKENQGVRDASQICRVRDVSMWCTRPFFPAPAGAARDASQICRVLAGAAYALRPLTVLCDPLYKCAGRLRVLVGWGRGVMGRVWGLNDLYAIY